MTKGNKIRLVVYILLSVFAVTFIFLNSMKSGEESYEQSKGLVAWVESILDPNDEVPTEDFNYAVRKVAHGLEFTLLGFAFGGLMCCAYAVQKRWHITTPLFFGLAVAVTDEFIQSFFARTSSVTDVLIDFGGVVCGVIIATALERVMLKRKCNK